MSIMGLGKSLYEHISNHTASYVLLEEDCGKLFTNQGASGAVTFTLPTAANLAAGWNATFFNAENQNLTVASAEGDNMAAFNDVAADSVALSTSNEKVGTGFYVVWDGTNFLVFVFLGADSVTVTVAT